MVDPRFRPAAMTLSVLIKAPLDWTSECTYFPALASAGTFHYNSRRFAGIPVCAAETRTANRPR
jgi:hypothetical protein